MNRANGNAVRQHDVRTAKQSDYNANYPATSLIPQLQNVPIVSYYAVAARARLSIGRQNDRRRSETWTN